MIEFDVDMGYLLEYDELDCVVLNDENGEHEPMEFVPKTGSGTCEVTSVKGRPSGNLEVRYSCGHMVIMQRGERRLFCPYCGKAVKR